jgi:hypothetical protein
LGGIGESKEMRKFNVASLVLSLAMLSGIASADVVIDGQNIPGADIQAITISPINGNIIISTKDGYTVTKGGDIDPPPPPGAVQITSFIASPNPVISGDSVTVEWSVENGVSCTSGGKKIPWRNQVPEPNSGSRSFNMTTGTWDFILTCSDASGGTDSKTVFVEVVENTQTSNCPSSTPISGNVTSWKGMFGVDFPMPIYISLRYLAVPRFGYSSIKFNTKNFVDSGKFSSIASTQTAGIRLATLTECPGDFSASVPDSCRYIWGSGGGLKWQTDGTPGCALEPNKDYYFNITYTNGISGASSTCLSTPCLMELQYSNN